ncbi:MAG: hypothetical protein AAGA77_24375, partial [Bacteroidota bacterium]
MDMFLPLLGLQFKNLDYIVFLEMKANVTDLILREYIILLKEKNLLFGSFLAFIIMGFGAFSVTRINSGGVRTMFFAAGFCALIFAFGSLILGVVRINQLLELMS